MKQIILVMLAILLSISKGYSQYRISIDSSFNFGDKERFLKQSTGLQGSVIAAQLNSRGNYVLAGNGIRVDQLVFSAGSVIEVTPKGDLVKVYNQVVPDVKVNQTITYFSDMYIDKDTEYIYLLATSPFESLKTPKGEKTGIIVLDKDLNEIKRISVPKQYSSDLEYGIIRGGEKFVYSEFSKELFIIASLDYNGNYSAILKLSNDSIIPDIYQPDYYLDWKQSFATIGKKMFTISRKVNSYYNPGRRQLFVANNGQMPDSTILGLGTKLNWQWFERLVQFTADQVLVYGGANGVKKAALINANLDIDTSSIVIRNLINDLDYTFTIGNKVFLKKYVNYNPDSAFAFNDYFWEMDLDGANFKPSEFNWYPDTNYRHFRQQYLQPVNVKGTNNFFVSSGSNVFFIENKRVNHNFFKRLGPDYRRIYDIQPTINNKFFVSGDFDFYNDTKCDGLVRINFDGSLDTTFRFYFTNFSFVKKVSRSDNFTMKPDIVSPLKNGYVILGFTETTQETRYEKSTFKLKNNGTIDTSFKLDTIPIFRFNKVQELGNGKYLVHRLENFNDEDYLYNLSPDLDINVTDTNGKTINQLLVKKQNQFATFHLVKVQILDPEHYLLAFNIQTNLEGSLEKGDFYIYKVAISDVSLANIQPLYYRKLSEYSFIDFNNDDNWSMKIQNKINKEAFNVIYFDKSGLAVDSFNTTDPLIALYPQIEMLDQVKLSFANSVGRIGSERFNLFSRDNQQIPYKSTDFASLVSSDYRRSPSYSPFGTNIKKINDTSFWYYSNYILFDNDTTGSISGFFRIKVKGTEIDSNPEKLNVNVFPNPTTGTASIQLPFYYEDGLNGNVLVMDMTGKLMQKDSFTLLKYENLQFDFSNYNTGLYFIRIEVNGRFYYTKLIKG